jgi:hypothetical protein
MMVAAQLRRLLGPVGHKPAGGRVRSDDEAVLLWVRLVPPAARGWGTLEGAVLLTSYTAEVITDDARGAGPGARLEVTVPAAVDEVAFASVRQRFAWLSDRGVDVEVSRGQRPPKLPRRQLALPSNEEITLHVESATVASRLARPGQL